MTPIAEASPRPGDGSRTERESQRAQEGLGRVAFTAKFGPDENGFPLRVVRGEQVIAAERNDIEAIVSLRLADADRRVLLDAQERRDEADTRVRLEQRTDDNDRDDRRNGSVVDLTV